MYPELLQLDLPVVGELTISSFGAMMALAFLVGYQLLRVQLRELDREPELAYDMLMGAVIGGLVGAKLYYAVQHAVMGPSSFFDLVTARAGLTWYGGFVGGALGVVVAARRRDADLGFVADLASPVLAASYAIGRIGCFLVGDDYGKPTDSWVGIAFPEGAPPTTAGSLRRNFDVDIPASVPDTAVLAVYPTQLFEVAMAGLIFLYLWPRRHHDHRQGWLAGAWMILAGAERLIVELFRAKDDRVLGPLSVAQLLSLALIALGAYLVARLRDPEAAATT